MSSQRYSPEFKDEAVRQITWEWLVTYNEEGPHKPPGGLPPAVFRERKEAENFTLEMST